jgi:hypothetical protein
VSIGGRPVYIEEKKAMGRGKLALHGGLVCYISFFPCIVMYIL